MKWYRKSQIARNSRTNNCFLPLNWRKPLIQLRPPPPSRYVSHGHGYSFFLSHEDDELLPPRDARVQKVPLQRDAMLHKYGARDARVALLQSGSKAIFFDELSSSVISDCVDHYH
jgi:hypothetical protein